MSPLRNVLSTLLCLTLLPLVAVGCATEGTSCDDLPPQRASFAQVSAFFMDAGAKGCVRCHNTREPVHGLNFDGPGVTYDALTTRYDAIYEQVASGAMPKDGARWSEGELNQLRSWHCQGAIYETP